MGKARPVASATASLKVMARNKPAACCVLLDAYVGVIEDPETGEETEQDVGAHCMLVVGGDLTGPRYVVFDPWGLGAGEISYWTAQDIEAAAPLAWIELSPQ